MKSIVWLRYAILNTTQPTITLMVGIPGSGKSFWVRHNAHDLTVISSDNLLELWAAEHGKTYSEAWGEPGLLKEIDKQMKADLALSLSKNEHIIVDRTNVSKGSRNKILSQVPKNYLRFAAVFKAARDVVDRRLDMRAKHTGKIIPPFVVDEMQKNYEPPTDEFDEIFVNDSISNYDT